MLRKYAGSLIMILVRIGSSLVINKLFAFFFGATGITLLSHLQNLFGIATQVPTEGIGKGLVKYLTDSQLNRPMKNVFVLAGFIWHLLVWLFCGIGMLLLIHPFFRLFPPSWSSIEWFGFVISALLGQLMFLYASALLLASHKIKAYLISQIVASGLVVGSIIIGISTQSIAFAALSFIVGQGLSAGIILFQVGHSIPPNEVLWNLLRYVQVYMLHPYFKKAFVALGKYSLMAVSVVLFGKTVDFFVRQFAVKEFGMETTGLWQAVVRTSDLYTQVFTALLGIVYFPPMAAVIHQKEKLRRLIRQTLELWVPVIILGLTAIYIARHSILYLLFNKEFHDGATFFKWQLPGDFFIMLSYFFAYVLLGNARIRLFVLLQVLSAAIYLLALAMLYKTRGIEALAMANFIRSAGYAICLIIFTRKDL